MRQPILPLREAHIGTTTPLNPARLAPDRRRVSVSFFSWSDLNSKLACSGTRIRSTPCSVICATSKIAICVLLKTYEKVSNSFRRGFLSASSVNLRRRSLLIQPNNEADKPTREKANYQYIDGDSEHICS